MDPEFVATLANPLHPDRPPVVQKGDYLVCSKTGIGFPIVDGIPHMLPEDAIEPEKMKELLHGSN